METGHFKPLHHSIGHLRRNKGCLVVARLKGQKGPPSGALRSSLVVLRRGVDTVHNEEIFEFLFPNISYSYTIV